ncbi:hypothetical protein NKH18_15075 [Streptomyces sp. M10(2022)]
MLHHLDGNLDVMRAVLENDGADLPTLVSRVPAVGAALLSQPDPVATARRFARKPESSAHC